MRTISASSVIGIVTIALHDGMIGGAMPATSTSLRVGQSAAITACVVKGAFAVARATEKTAHDHVNSASLLHACKWLTKGAVTKSCAREQQGHRCDLQNAPCGMDVLGAQARASTLALFGSAEGSLLRMARQDARR